VPGGARKSPRSGLAQGPPQPVSSPRGARAKAREEGLAYVQTILRRELWRQARLGRCSSNGAYSLPKQRHAGTVPTPPYKRSGAVCRAGLASRVRAHSAVICRRFPLTRAFVQTRAATAADSFSAAIATPWAKRPPQPGPPHPSPAVAASARHGAARSNREARAATRRVCLRLHTPPQPE
jgi:hypothetical protein